MKFSDNKYIEFYSEIRSSRKPSELEELQLKELVLHISEGCNLCCSYCFASAGKYTASNSKFMSYETSKKIITEWLKSRPSIASIKLFGGEPFMNPAAMRGCADALDELSEELDDRANLPAVVCVSNLTIFNPELVDLAKRLDLRITVSIDGPVNIHDANRTFRDGRGSYNVICENIAKYREHGVSVDSIECVYTQAHLQAGITLLELHQHIVKQFGVSNVHISPLAVTDSMPGQAEYVAAIRNMAKEYLAHAVSMRDIDPSFTVVMNRMMQPLMSYTSKLGWCTAPMGYSTLTVACDGSVYPCYGLMRDRDFWYLDLSCATQLDDSEHNRQIFHLLDAANPRVQEQCAGCDIREICASCPGVIFAAGGEFTGKELANCHFQIGAIEGVLDGWNTAYEKQKEN